MPASFQLGSVVARNEEASMAAEQSGGKTLDERIRLIEDRLEIYNLIASHPPSADTGAGALAAGARHPARRAGGVKEAVIASETKQSPGRTRHDRWGLLRRCAPRNDSIFCCQCGPLTPAPLSASGERESWQSCLRRAVRGFI